MEGGALTRACFLAGRLSGGTTRISQDRVKTWARGLVTKTYFLTGRAARTGRDTAKACARGLATKTYFLAGRLSGRTMRISRGSAKVCARGAVHAATWTTQRVASSARLLNPFNWRRRAGSRGLQRETEIRVAERLRIGQDLHDGVGQTLSGVAFMSRALERKLAGKLGPDDDGAADAAQIAEIAEEAMAQTRSMARVLNRAELSAGGLTLALEEMASDFEKVFGVSCTFDHDADILIEDDAVATHLYRIAQEAATNAIRHGRAKRIVIGLNSPVNSEGLGGAAALTVQDDGTGFEREETTADEATGMGLRIMDYRAGIIGGAVTVRRRPEGGTLLTCTFLRGRKQQVGGSEDDRRKSGRAK